MEKVKIIECNEIMGGKAYGVKLEDGREATAWCDKIEAGVLMGAFSSHQEIEMEIVPYKSKSSGKEGLNVKALGPLTGAKVDPVIEKVLANVDLGNKPSTGDSIIAQCMTKCACYGRNDLTIEKVVEMYKEAVKLL